MNSHRHGARDLPARAAPETSSRRGERHCRPPRACCLRRKSLHRPRPCFTSAAYLPSSSSRSKRARFGAQPRSCVFLVKEGSSLSCRLKSKAVYSNFPERLRHSRPPPPCGAFSCPANGKSRTTSRTLLPVGFRVPLPKRSWNSSARRTLKICKFTRLLPELLHHRETGSSSTRWLICTGSTGSRLAGE